MTHEEAVRSKGLVTHVLKEDAAHLSGPQLPPLVQAVDESRREPDVVPHDWFVVCQTVDVAHASAEISVHHRGQFTVSELKDAMCNYTVPCRWNLMCTLCCV